MSFAELLLVQDVQNCHFYHTMDLPGLETIHGEWDLRGRFKDYTDHYDFRNKRVLDIGAGSGFLSFSAEQQCAKEVVSFDMDSSCRQDFLPFHQKFHFIDRPNFEAEHNKWIKKWRNAYWLSHRLLKSSAKCFYGDIYKLPNDIGQFDVTIVGSILEHLADPIKALASISRVTSGHMIITTPILETDEKIARFEGDCLKPDQDYVFWTYSRGIYHHVLGMLGFEIERISHYNFLAEWDGGKEHRRSVITARRRS